MYRIKFEEFSFRKYFRNILDRWLGIDRRPPNVRDYEDKLKVIFATSCVRVK